MVCLRLAKIVVPYTLFSSLACARPTCKCLYGQRCWPSNKEFSQLASQLSLPLLHPAPPESACYPVGNPSGNCSDVVANAHFGNWRSEFSGSMQDPYWETYTFLNGTISACYLNTTLGVPCEQGAIPVVGVDARSENDVQAAVNFASKHNLRLVVKNTGHDYLGRSTARNSFLIWTHHLKNITYHETFRPVGAPRAEVYASALTLGAGVQWHEAYDAANAHGRLMVGGLSAGASVGAAGGWILGGGHSALSPRYGLGVDNVLQFRLVTADGRVLTVNAHSHSDLFWALRGGGGGTFGVVTAVTYMTHPSVPVIGIFGVIPFASPAVAKSVVTEFIRLQPSWANVGWGGYSNLDSTGLQFFYIAPNASWATVNATIQPFNDFVLNATAGGPSVQNVTLQYDSFYLWYQFLFGGGEQVGGNVLLGSRLIPQASVEKDPQNVTETLLSLSGGASWYLVTGGAVSKVNSKTTGLNPAWRQAIAHVVIGQGWAEGATASAIASLGRKLQNDVAKLEALAPGSGAYFNEASPFEPNPQTTFFGIHYSRLKSIKTLYDPASLFVVANGVESEEWDPTLDCRR